MSDLPRLSIRIGAGLAAALAASIGISEGRKYLAYQDTGGVWTVCDGITGPDVIKGKRYTDLECDALLDKHLDYHAGKVLQCIHEPMGQNETFAWVHFSYNIGPTKFCGSTAARKLNAGDHKGACEEIPKWRFVAGKDCRIASSNCKGIIVRRAKEYLRCLEPDQILTPQQESSTH